MQKTPRGGDVRVGTPSDLPLRPRCRRSKRWFRQPRNLRHLGLKTNTFTFQCCTRRHGLRSFKLRVMQGEPMAEATTAVDPQFRHRGPRRRAQQRKMFGFVLRCGRSLDFSAAHLQPPASQPQQKIRGCQHARHRYFLNTRSCSLFWRGCMIEHGQRIILSLEFAKILRSSKRQHTRKRPNHCPYNIFSGSNPSFTGLIL